MLADGNILLCLILWVGTLFHLFLTQTCYSSVLWIYLSYFSMYILNFQQNHTKFLKSKFLPVSSLSPTLTFTFNSSTHIPLTSSTKDPNCPLESLKKNKIYITKSKASLYFSNFEHYFKRHHESIMI